MHDQYDQNCKTLIKEFKDLNKCRDIPCSGAGRLNIIKMTTPTKAIYWFNGIPLIFFFCRNKQDYPKICMEFQDTLNNENDLEKEHEWRTHTSQFQNLLQTTVIKIVWYWHKNGHLDQ